MSVSIYKHNGDIENIHLHGKDAVTIAVILFALQSNLDTFECKHGYRISEEAKELMRKITKEL